MRTAVISMEVVCIIVLLTVLYGCIFELRAKSATARQYTISLVVALAALTVDLLSHLQSGVCSDALLFAFKLLSLAIRPWIAVCFVGYLLACVNTKKSVTYWYVYAAVIFNACGTLFLLIGTFRGNMFAVVNGKYVPGEWYMISQYCTIATMAYIAVIDLRCWKILGAHDALAAVFYLLFPGIALLLEDFLPGVAPAYVAVALSLVVIYVVMQVREVSSCRAKAQNVQESTNTDPLTGLMNRRAYDEKLASIHAAKHVGVVFADLNGLKFVNEHFGHRAGDALLVSFAGMLGSHFRQEDCFRISGDEFVVILDGIADGGFFQRVKEMRAENESKNEIAAIGIMHGSGAEVLDLIRTAEREMQEEKKAFYRSNPQYFRQ